MSVPPASRILITGFSGFVGRYLIQECRARYPHAALFGLAEHLPATECFQHLQLTPLQADITHPEQVRAAIACAQPDLVFHLAAQASVAASWSNPALTLAINAGGAVHLLEAIRAEQLAPRVVLVGSGEEYGIVPPEDNPIREDHELRPANPYAVAKATQDLFGYQYFVAYGLPVVRVRAFNHFGPGQPTTFVIPSLMHQIALIEARKQQALLLVGNLVASRDFLPVRDVVRAYIAVAEHGRSGAAYNVGSGQARSIRSILDHLLALSPSAIEVREDPSRLRPVDMPLLTADITRLATDTGWQPVEDFAQALKHTLDYWRASVQRG